MDETTEPSNHEKKPARKQPAQKQDGIAVNTPVAQVYLPREVSVVVAPAVLFFFYCLGACAVLFTLAYCVSMIWKPTSARLPELPETPTVIPAEPLPESFQSPPAGENTPP